MALVKVKIKSIIYDDLYKSPVLILKEENGLGVVPLWIGKKEAELLNEFLIHNQKQADTNFPSLGDSMLYYISETKGNIIRFVLDRIENSMYRGFVLIKNNKRIFKLYCRPTDGIALTLRAKSPIYSNENLMNFINDEDNLENDYSFIRKYNQINQMNPEKYQF